jgi:hypothetical protein
VPVWRRSLVLAMVLGAVVSCGSDVTSPEAPVVPPAQEPTAPPPAATTTFTFHVLAVALPTRFTISARLDGELVYESAEAASSHEFTISRPHVGVERLFEVTILTADRSRAEYRAAATVESPPGLGPILHVDGIQWTLAAGETLQLTIPVR